MDREGYKQFRLQRLFSKVLSEWHYARFLKSMYEAQKENTSLKVEIRDKEQLKAITIPHSLMDLQRTVLTPLENLVSSVLAAFDIEYNHGYNLKQKGILNLIKRYPGLSDQDKYKLLDYILSNLNLDGGL